MRRAVSEFIHTPFKSHLNEHTLKHSCMHRRQKEQGDLYLALRLFLPFCTFWKSQVRFCWRTCILCLPENSWKDLIWLDHQTDNVFVSNSKDEVDDGLVSVKFRHDFNQKLTPPNELNRWKDSRISFSMRAYQYWRLSSFCPSSHRYLVADKWDYYRQWHRNCQTIATYTKVSAANTKLLWRKAAKICCSWICTLIEFVFVPMQNIFNWYKIFCASAIFNFIV